MLVRYNNNIILKIIETNAAVNADNNFIKKYNYTLERSKENNICT